MAGPAWACSASWPVNGIDRLLAGHQHAKALPPDQGADPASLDPVVQVLPPWYRDGRGSWPA
ncbi:MAG TPA: hypothetical protein VG673_13185 [Actinomycetota bacterium]|nr:hypothetical protein [Actinomycetota bacterium]